ncbi:MAG: 30S ribosomal protein S20 [Spirochaetota bacterium]
MANIKSSKKDIKKSAKRRELNAQKKSAIRTYAKNILKAVKAEKKEEANTLFVKYSSLLDKAAKISLVHKNNASRNKSRMAKKINALK